jgi:hypothetical protein
VECHRDGVFVFDFTDWAPGAPVTIPGYTLPSSGRIPDVVTKAEETAMDHLYQAISVMNAHLACMSSALSIVQGQANPLQQVISPATYFVARNLPFGRHLEGLNVYWEPIHAYVALNSQLDADVAGRRRRIVIGLDAVNYSFDLLDEILTKEIPDLLKLINLIYLAAISYGQHDFPTAQIMAWTVCERLLRILWGRYIEQKSEIDDEDGGKVTTMNKKRKEKLFGIDYTASVISEVLALSGVLNHDLYTKIDQVRIVRNGWLHSLKSISADQASTAISTAQEFLKEISGIRLLVTLSYSMHF